MSPLGLKARVGSLICTWQRCMCYTFPKIHLRCNTSQPLGGQHGSQANLFHVPVSRYWWDSKLGPVVLHTKALPTELCQLGTRKEMLSLFETLAFGSLWLCRRFINLCPVCCSFRVVCMKSHDMSTDK